MTNHKDIGYQSLSQHEPLITEDQAAEFLCLSKRTLQNWRWRGGGPPFVRMSGRAVRYRRQELVSWVECRLAHSTSDVLAPPVARNDKRVAGDAR